MRRNYCINLAICLMGWSPVISQGAGPATRPGLTTEVIGVPATTQEGTGGQSGGQSGGQLGGASRGASSGSVTDDVGKPRRPFGDGQSPRRMFQRFPAPTEDDKTNAMDFMRTNSHNRYVAIDAMPDGKNKNRAKELAALNYLNWMQVQKDDPELYPVVLRRVKVEDDIFGLWTELKSEQPDKAEAIRAKLREKVAALIDSGIEERQIRLNRLAKTVKEQQQQLAEDSAHRDKLVDERLKTILEDEKSLVPNTGGGSRGRNGPRPPGDIRPGDIRPTGP